MREVKTGCKGGGMRKKQGKRGENEERREEIEVGEEVK